MDRWSADFEGLHGERISRRTIDEELGFSARLSGPTQIAEHPYASAAAAVGELTVGETNGVGVESCECVFETTRGLSTLGLAQQCRPRLLLHLLRRLPR